MTTVVARAEGLILPNMYAYGKVEIKRRGAWTVPLEALVELGNQTSCYEFQDGKAVVLPVQRGIDDGTSVELIKKRIKGEWMPFTGSERIIALARQNMTWTEAGQPLSIAASPWRP